MLGDVLRASIPDEKKKKITLQPYYQNSCTESVKRKRRETEESDDAYLMDDVEPIFMLASSNRLHLTSGNTDEEEKNKYKQQVKELTNQNLALKVYLALAFLTTVATFSVFLSLYLCAKQTSRRDPGFEQVAPPYQPSMLLGNNTHGSYNGKDFPFVPCNCPGNPTLSCQCNTDDRKSHDGPDPAQNSEDNVAMIVKPVV